MFAGIYRSFVKEGKEEEYLKSWKVIADYFVRERGALGSTLHKTAEGMWVAYSRWESQTARDASWPEGDEINPTLPQYIQAAIKTLKSCLDLSQKLPDVTMSVVEEVIPK